MSSATRSTAFPNVLTTEPLEYATFARLLGRCELAITDSGGIQEEAPALGKPVLVTRDSTERLEGVEAGTLLLVGTDPDVIAPTASALLDDRLAYASVAEAINPYGDGRAAQRIVAALEHLQHGGPAPEPYGPGYRRELVLEAAGYQEGLRPPLLPDAARGVLEERVVDHGIETWHVPR